MTRTQFKSELFLSAWEISREDNLRFDKALTMAWKSAKLTEAMRTGARLFSFRKTDGTLRTAFGTLQSFYLPASKGNGERKHKRTTQVYWDIDKNQYRSFRKSSLVAV